MIICIIAVFGVFSGKFSSLKSAERYVDAKKELHLAGTKRYVFLL